MPFTLEDDLAQAAHLSDLTPEQTRLALAVGLFAEDRLTLAQAAALAGLDRLAFQRHLAARGIPLRYQQEGFDMDLAELARRSV
jgi:predicted HTH domain antitoxin